jgi:hypothetical protein
MSMAMMSLVATLVVVKSDIVDDWIAVPLEMATPLVLMEFPDVGMAVPLATFQNFTVMVPVSMASA